MRDYAALTRVDGAPTALQTDVRYFPRIQLPNDPPQEPIAIADMAELFDVTHRTLHFYEQKGLLTCGRDGLRRVYRAEDLARMALISLCRDVGMSIATIQTLFDELKDADAPDRADQIFQAALTEHLDELNSSLSNLKRQTDQLKQLLDAKCMSRGHGAASVPTVALTATEHTCLELMAEGYSTIRLVRALGLERTQVEKLERTIIRKLGANNRFQAVAKAVLVGILTTHQPAVFEDGEIEPF